MEPLDLEKTGENGDPYKPHGGKYEMSYPELCSEFLTTLAKAIKNTALYGLSHPVVLESLRKTCALLGMIFDANKDIELTLSFVNDSWLFNDAPVPAVTQESQNLNAFFKAHRVQGLTFVDGVQCFEIGALAEFLGAQSKNRPESYITEFFAGKGVVNIRPETTHYVKEGAYLSQASASKGFPSAAPAARTTQARPAPGIIPTPQPRPAAAKPAQLITPALQPRPAAARPVPASAPVLQARPAAVAPAPVTAPALQPRPAAVRPAVEVRPVRAPDGGKTDLDGIFGPGPRSGNGGGPGGGKAAEGPGGGKGPESVLTNMSFGGILKGLVESAVKDPKDRVHAYEDALKMIRETMEQQVAESTRALAAEKEQALNTRARTERVLSKVADGKVIVDKDGKILMMNPAAEEIAGTKFADAAGKHISEQLRPGEHVLTLSKDMDISGGKIISGEVEVKGDEPVGRALRRSVAMLVDADGRVVGELSTLPEITKYKEAQRMQDEFLSRVTHDLQSPLSSIASALEMLNDAAANKLDPTENKFLDISIRNSHRLSQMIRGILDFSKLQSGKMDVHPVPAQVAPMLAEAGEGLMPWAKTKGITLTVRPVSRDLYALADPVRIVQVLTNLISNAIKATPEGGAVSVAAAPHPSEAGTVLFGVRDTGHGIPKEDLDRIFEKFVQLPSHQAQEGVGLGLAIVTDFVKLHSGRIWAVSEDGKGATFYFTLPMAEKKSEVLQ